jgi:DNA-binding SARP family transcriptional activator
MDALGARREPSYVGVDVEIRVLGPLAVASDGAEVHLGGRKQRTVFALLAAEVGKAVSVDALIDGVWARSPHRGRARRCRRMSRISGP